MKKSRIKLSLFSLILALLLFGLTIVATGREPLSVYWSILAGSFGSLKGFLNVLAYMLPLVMTGLGAAVAFQSGVFNIGGEGQVLVGGLASVIAGLLVPFPAPWGYLFAMAVGFLAGAIWAVLPTLIAGRNLALLSVATIMMNSIAALLTEYIVKQFFQREGASNTETVVVNEGSILPRFFPGTQFNYGIFVAIICVILVTWFLYKTPFGFSLRAMGNNPRAIQQAGVPVYRRTLAAMFISGGLFALGGSIQCLAVYKRFVMGFSPGYGWDGITVATLAANSPVGVLLSAFLFGMLRSASINMSLTNQVTTEMISVLQGLIVILVASPMVWTTMSNLFYPVKARIAALLSRKTEADAT
nr:ABC transporter permease [uncultured Oscillibacter sp.]